MPEHRIGTREEWKAARTQLATLEAEHGVVEVALKWFTGTPLDQDQDLSPLDVARKWWR